MDFARARDCRDTRVSIMDQMYGNPNYYGYECPAPQLGQRSPLEDCVFPAGHAYYEEQSLPRHSFVPRHSADDAASATEMPRQPTARGFMPR